MKPNILICGKTGAGRTSLVQAVTHAGITCGVGKAAKACFESGMTLDMDDPRKEFIEGEKVSKNPN